MRPVRVRLRSEYRTDPRLIHGKMKLCIRCKIRHNGTRIPKQIKVSRLKELAVGTDIEFKSTWDLFKTKVYSTHIDILDFRKRKNWDWFSEYDAEKKKHLLKVKKMMHIKVF